MEERVLAVTSIDSFVTDSIMRMYRKLLKKGNGKFLLSTRIVRQLPANPQTQNNNPNAILLKQDYLFKGMQNFIKTQADEMKLSQIQVHEKVTFTS